MTPIVIAAIIGGVAGVVGHAIFVWYAERPVITGMRREIVISLRMQVDRLIRDLRAALVRCDRLDGKLERRSRALGEARSERESAWSEVRNAQAQTDADHLTVLGLRDQLAQVTAERDEAAHLAAVWREQHDGLQWSYRRQSTDLATLRAQLASAEGERDSAVRECGTWRTQAALSADLCASATANAERLARLYAPFDPARKDQPKDALGRFVRRDSPDTLKKAEAA